MVAAGDRVRVKWLGSMVPGTVVSVELVDYVHGYYLLVRLEHSRIVAGYLPWEVETVYHALESEYK